MSPKTTAETTDRTTTARLLLVIIFALVAGMALLLSPASVQTADAAQVHKIRTAAQWHDIGKYNGGTFKIMNNIKLTSESQYLTISKNKKYTIDFNGKTVKTTYTGVALRTTAPLCVNKGTMVIKTSNKKGKGVLYSTETAAVVLQGNAKLYFKSGSIVDDATEFRSDITSAIMTYDNSKCYLQGKCKIQSIGNGVALMGASKLYATPLCARGRQHLHGAVHALRQRHQHRLEEREDIAQGRKLRHQGDARCDREHPRHVLLLPPVRQLPPPRSVRAGHRQRAENGI